jgi:2-polyprenyl-3-methyl-5-hydroxy-6-metoxy-1,4-benzoquinol methylase
LHRPRPDSRGTWRGPRLPVSWKPGRGALAKIEELRDQAIAEDVRRTLSDHQTLAGLPLAVEVRGAVVHLTGSVRTADERRMARAVVGRVHGVLAVWERLTLPGAAADRVLDIGCGGTKQLAGSVGLDRHCQPGVDLVANLEHGLPFADESFDQVFAVHVLEHVLDLVPLMNEVHRVLRPGGVLHAITPAHDFVNAVADPTHVRFFDVQTFKYFCCQRPGLHTFRPLSVGRTPDSILADLEPVKSGQTPPSPLELARHFT